MKHRKGSIVTVPVGQDDPIRIRAKIISGPHRLTDDERANLFDNFGIRAATYYRVGIGSRRLDAYSPFIRKAHKPRRAA